MIFEIDVNGFSGEQRVVPVAEAGWVPSFLAWGAPHKILEKLLGRDDTGSEEVTMRDLRDFVPGQIYGVTQRGNTLNTHWPFCRPVIRPQPRRIQPPLDCWAADDGERVGSAGG